jgi:uroporphyrinogen-III decarboxylase
MSMTSRERLITAFHKGKPDRLPIFIRGVNVLDERWVEHQHPSYRPLIDYVREKTDPVVFWSAGWGYGLSATPAEAVTRRVLKEDAEWREVETRLETPLGPLTQLYRHSTLGKPGFTTKHFLCEPEDAERLLSLPYRPIEPELEAYHALARKVGESGLVLPLLGGAMMWLHEIIDSETLALWSVTHRQVVHHLLRVFNERVLELMGKLLVGGCGPVIGSIGQELATPPLLPPRDFEEFVAEYDRPVFDLIHRYGATVHIHCHGRLRQVLDGFLRAGADSLHPVEAPPLGDITLRDFRDRAGLRIAVKGNIQIGDIYRGRPEDIARQVQDAFAAAGREGAFILAPTASPFWPELPQRALVNYRAMIDAGRECGVY